MRTREFEKSLIALSAWREARQYGGAQAMIMVANCIYNRVRNGWGTATDVVEKIPMFAAYKLEEQPVGYPDSRDPAFQRLLMEIDKIGDGTAADITDGACFWADLGKVTRDWFKTAIIDKPGDHPRVGNLQTLYFWK